MRRGTRCVAAITAAAALGALRLGITSVPASAPGAEGASAAAPTNFGEFVSSLRTALEEVRPLEAQVEEGKIVPKFGEKADAIIKKARSSAGGGQADMERAVDGALQALFLKQLALLRQQVSKNFENAGRPVEQGHATMTKADAQFVKEAQDLVRPGSAWSFEEERLALRAFLEGSFRRDAALAEEKARSVQTQQATVDIINKLQTQMETIQQKMQGMQAGSPWVLSTSYRLPGTPLQIIGRYQQGRANVELNLTPDRDPANSEAGFVEGIGPANVGLSFNVGV